MIIKSFFLKESILFLIALMLLNNPIFSQEAFKIDTEGKIITSNIKQVLQKRGYDAISAFDTISASPMMVCAIYVQNKQLGIVNSNGKEITKAAYSGFIGIETLDKIIFSKGFLIGYKGKKFGVINHLGDEVIPFIYDHILPINRWERKKFNITDKHLFTVRKGSTEYVVNEKNEILKQEKQSSMGYFSHSPRRSKDNIFGHYVRPLSNLKMQVIAKDNRSGLKGIYNPKTNKLVVEQKYSELKQGVGQQIIAQKERKWGIIDINENTLLDFKYNRIEYSAGGYKVKKGENVAYFSSDLKPSTDFIYDGSMSRSTWNMKFLTLSKNKKIGVLNSSGKEVTEFIYDNIRFEEICYPKDKDNEKRKWLIIATLNGKKGLLDDKGKKLLDFEYDNFDFYRCMRDENNIPQIYFSFKKNGKYGFYGKNLKLILKDLDKIKWNYQGKNSLYAYKKKGNTDEWSVYNLTSNKLYKLPNEFFFDGRKSGGYYNFESNLSSLYFIRKDGKYGINDGNGNQIIKPSIELNNPTRPFCRAKEIYKGLVSVVFGMKTYNRYNLINVHDYYIDYNANSIRVD